MGNVFSRWSRGGLVTLTVGALGVCNIAVAEQTAEPRKLAPIHVDAESRRDPTPRSEVMGDYRGSKAGTTVDSQTARDFNSANNYDALRLVPGVSFLANAGGRFGAPSRIRSATTWGVADTIDDYPSINPAGIGAENGGLEGGPGAMIPSIALESIQVQKGGLGVQFGTDADGGVIVNRLKQGRSGGPRGGVWLEASPIAEQLLMADVGGGSEDGQWDYYAAGKLLNGDYDHMAAQNGDELQSDEFYSGLSKLGFNPDDDSRLEWLLLSGRDEVAYRTRNGVDYTTTNETLFTGLSWKQRLNARWGYDLGYTYYRDRAVRYNEANQASERDRPQRAHTAYGNVYFDTALSDTIDYSLAMGLEHELHEQREEADTAAAKQQEFRDSSVYLMNSFTLAERIVLNGGLRYLDASDDFRDHSLLAHDLGAAYTFERTGTKLRATHSSGYSRNKGFAYFFGPIAQAGGVRLTESETTELGLVQPFADARGMRLGGVELSLFRTDYEHVPTFGGWGASEVYYNEVEAEGVELSGDWIIGDALSIFGSVTYLDNEITDTSNPSGAGVGSTQLPIPQTSAALGVEWQASPKLRLQTIAVYDEGRASRQVDVNSGAVTVTEWEGYTRWNAAAYYDFDSRWTAFARVENLLDEENLGYTSTKTGQPEQALEAEDPGRFFSVGIRYRY